MSIIIGLADELEDLAHRADVGGSLYAGEHPRAVNLLRARAAQLRQPKGKRGKAKTVQAWVGKRQSKASEIRIKADRLEE